MNQGCFGTLGWVGAQGLWPALLASRLHNQGSLDLVLLPWLLHALWLPLSNRLGLGGAFLGPPLLFLPQVTDVQAGGHTGLSVLCPGRVFW